ncbi:ABC-type nickel/cobalt efflux system permease component RcnA [Desulfohalotomaculum tongense]|uniref:nickel/cobalt transporter n=1 Tax=Desulforadius tongensis TaxID=1216062 RepID=UPI00195C8AD1|nr:sulfite exporter TauE/SafE family protein [Desulforadius tongensis]MBM7853747.1 ABC-type nickel/cobalt efflux system permease component RcnA [Desulforadius tongensis]
MGFIAMLVSAFGIGALHALEPGHGKSIMGAYLVLSRGRAVHAVVLGLTSAVTHTGVIVIMSLAAHGVLGAAAGPTGMSGERTELWLKVISGLFITVIGLRMALRRAPGCSCGCSTGHLPADSSTVEWPTLVLLGVTNGLIPCPSALAVLLMSISTGALASGMALVVAFGVGGAAALIAVGLALLKLSKGAVNLTGRRGWSRLANLSGGIIAAIGFFTCYGAVKALLV